MIVAHCTVTSCDITPTNNMFEVYKVTTSSQRGAPEGGSARSPLLPVLQCLRLMGRLPLTIHQDGTLSFSVLSWSLLYCIFTMTAQLLMAVYVIKVMAGFASDWEDFDVAVGTAMELIILTVILHPVLITWKETPAIVASINRWTSKQAFFNEVVKKPISSTILDRPYRGVICMTVLTAVEYTPIVLGDNDFDIIIVVEYGLLLFYFNYMVWFWIVFTKMITTTASLLQDSLVEAISKNGDAAVVRDHRLLWQELQEFSSGLADAVGGTIRAWEINLLLSFILGLYRSAMFMAEGKMPPPSTLAHPMVSGAQILLLHSLSSSADNKVGHEFLVRILSCNLSNFSHKLSEVKILLDAIENSNGRFFLRGMLDFTRFSILDIIESTLTYLVILVQFKSSA